MVEKTTDPTKRLTRKLIQDTMVVFLKKKKKPKHVSIWTDILRQSYTQAHKLQIKLAVSVLQCTLAPDPLGPRDGHITSGVWCGSYSNTSLSHW